jgi:hypothetical protein
MLQQGSIGLLIPLKSKCLKMHISGPNPGTYKSNHSFPEKQHGQEVVYILGNHVFTVLCWQYDAFLYLFTQAQAHKSNVCAITASLE